MTRRYFSTDFKRDAACLVLDKDYSVSEACEAMGVGPTALRRWVEQLRAERSGKTPEKSKAMTVDQQRIQERRIAATPRKVLVSDTFHCPAEHLQGWEQIRRSVIEGEDLNPYLSKLIGKVKKTDLLLSDWGVHHLHLGTVLEGQYMARTGPLLFARVTEEVLYAIDIYTHEDFADADIVEVIHRNWPKSIEHWILRGIQTRELTSDQRKVLRKKRYNSFVQTTDGTTYAPIGGGYVFSGHSIYAITEMDKEHHLLESLEQLVSDLIPALLPELQQRGYEIGTEAKVKLLLTDLAYFAHFTEYGIATELQKRRPGPWSAVVSKNANTLKWG